MQDTTSKFVSRKSFLLWGIFLCVVGLIIGVVASSYTSLSLQQKKADVVRPHQRAIMPVSGLYESKPLVGAAYVASIFYTDVAVKTVDLSKPINPETLCPNGCGATPKNNAVLVVKDQRSGKIIFAQMMKDVTSFDSNTIYHFRWQNDKLIIASGGGDGGSVWENITILDMEYNMIITSSKNCGPTEDSCSYSAENKGW